MKKYLILVIANFLAIALAGGITMILFIGYIYLVDGSFEGGAGLILWPIQIISAIIAGMITTIIISKKYIISYFISVPVFIIILLLLIYSFFAYT